MTKFQVEAENDTWNHQVIEPVAGSKLLQEKVSSDSPNIVNTILRSSNFSMQCQSKPINLVK